MSVVPSNEKKSPKISRFITESFTKPPSKRHLIVFSVSFISGLLLVAIGTQVVLLNQYHVRESLLVQEREQLAKQVAYWQQVTEKYPDYRDAHYRLAMLEYQRGNKEASQGQLQKVYQLDPHFEEGKVLGAKIER